MNNSNNIALYQRGTDFLALRLDPNTPRIKAIAPNNGIVRLQQMVLAACTLRGQKTDKEIIEGTAAALWEEITADFPLLTMEEVGYAIKQGTYEKYGEVYGINAVSLYKMVASYTESSEQQALAERVRMAKEQKMQTQAAKNAEWLAQHPEYKRTTL